MKFQKKYIFVITLCILSIFICSQLWSFIKFPINRYDIIGEYSLNNYSPLNDVIKYLIFIFIPLAVFLISKKIIFKIPFSNILTGLKIKDESYNSEKKIYYLLFFLMIYLATEFLSLTFSTHPIDIYHEGQRLSSAFKSLLDDSLWSGSYVTIGIIYETIGTKFIWQMFNNESIGLMRFLDIVYILITKILLVLLFFEVTRNIKFNLNYKLIFFLVTSLVGLGLINYNLYSTDNIHFREIPILLSLIVIIRSLNKSSLISNLILGLLSVLVFLWSIDRGIVFCLFLIFFFLFLILNKRFKDILYIVFSVILFWSIFYFTNNEFNYFIKNTYLVLKELNYVHGIIHPTPFSDEENSWRATKNILTIIFCLIFSMNFLFNKTNEGNYNKFNFILLFLSIICFLSYIYSLGRSDGPHLKQSYGFPAIFLIIVITNYSLFFLSKLNLKLFENFKSFYLMPFIFIIFLIGTKSNFKNIITYNDRFLNYIKFEDSKFLNNGDQLFIKQASKILKNEKCIQLFSNDSALLYLLKKPSCSKYYFFWSVGSEKNQNNLISELNSSNFIIAGGSTDNWSLPLSIKYPLLNKFLEDKFKDKIIIEKRTIFYNK